MPILSNDEAQALSELVERGRALVDAARLLRGTQKRSITRSDLAMREFMDALARAETVNRAKLKVRRS